MARALSILTLLALAVGGLAAAPRAFAPEDGATTLGAPGERDPYVVVLDDAPLATYQGGIDGLAPTAAHATGADRLDARSPASQAYLAYLAARHDAFVTTVEAALGRTVEVHFRYDAVLNGLSLDLDPTEAALVAGLPGVVHVERNQILQLHTDAGPAWIGAPSIWDGSQTGGLDETMGEGIVVGIIDTGVNFAHPSFAEVGPVDGHVHSNPFGFYLGLCDPVLGVPFCNDKLIGVWDFTGTGPQDDNAHGSHVASTAAGNLLDATLLAPTIEVTRTISGVAPHANLITYKACVSFPVSLGCFLNGTLGSINQATLDGVDVLNFSIGGVGSNPWTNTLALAFRDAVAAGVFVATSAGNSGPGPGTMGSPGNAPWITTIGANTHNRDFANSLVDMAGGLTIPPPDTRGAGVTSGYGPARIVYAGDFGDPLCRDPFPGGTWDGEIVLCDRGENPRVEKAENVAAGGAGGFVLANEEASGDSIVADPFAIPGVAITHNDGIDVKAWIAAGGGADHDGVAVITGLVLDEAPANADVMAAFSSRGPNVPAPHIIKPDLTVPGVDIFAAFNAPPIGDPETYGVISGTSMSSPHATGAAALIRALHPGWTPDEVRAALMTTAFFEPPGTGDEVQEVRKHDGETPADPFDQGTGRIDLRQAGRAGFVLHETVANYTAADPDSGGDPTTLNIPSLGNADCEETCSWTRTLRSTLDRDVDWTATTTGDVPLTVVPGPFTLDADGEAQLVVTATVTDLAPGQWLFGRVHLTPDDADVPAASLPVAVFVGGEDLTIDVVTLHFHGNDKDGCTGVGQTDVVDTDTPCPYLSMSDELDPGTAARYGPLDGGGPAPTGPRDPAVPNWTWWLDGPVVVRGDVLVEWWVNCALCQPALASEWDIRLWADGKLITEQRVTTTPPPNVTTRLTGTIIAPEFAAVDEIVVQIDPVWDDMLEITFYYDGQGMCPAATASGPCDSRIHLPIVVAPAGPIASDVDTFAISGTPRVIHVLDNDIDPEGGELTVEAIEEEPDNGTVSIVNGTVVYTPTDGWVGVDQFVYRIRNEEGLTDTATVTVTVHLLGDISWACPAGDVPEGTYDDTHDRDDSEHTLAVECVTWWEVAEGFGDGRFGPDDDTRRDQMASFVARALEKAGVALPQDPPHAFSDVPTEEQDPDYPHRLAINQLAALGVVEGLRDEQGQLTGEYGPSGPVRRNSMASFLARAWEVVEGRPLSMVRTDYFTDIAGDTHEDNINRIREAGFTTGVTATTYDPAGPVKREQMGSFLARFLNRAVQEGFANPPDAS